MHLFVQFYIATFDILVFECFKVIFDRVSSEFSVFKRVSFFPFLTHPGRLRTVAKEEFDVATSVCRRFS